MADGQDLKISNDEEKEKPSDTDFLIDGFAALKLNENEEVRKDGKEAVHQKASRKTGLVFDKRMQKHFNMWDKGHPERPSRISAIFDQLTEAELVSQCHIVSPRLATFKELTTIHSERHINEMESLLEMSPRNLHNRGEDFDSIYLSPDVFECASIAAGCTLELLDSLLTNKVRNGAAIVRPPGHHACCDYPMGFCYFNNVAIAAQIAKKKYGIKRVLIVDWDIHWGNGTQQIFEEDPSVLYFSIHRYDETKYWPHKKEANYDEVGKGEGEGKTIHVAWNKKGMGDSEYLTAFTMLLLPVAYEFNPELVLVSCGFDSGLGDPKGLCNVTPEGFAQMTHLLIGLANGKVLLALEGGYNLRTNSYSMEACVECLLGYACPTIEADDIDDSALQSIMNTCHTHSKYWKCLKWAATILKKETKIDEKCDKLSSSVPEIDRDETVKEEQ